MLTMKAHGCGRTDPPGILKAGLPVNPMAELPKIVWRSFQVCQGYPGMTFLVMLPMVKKRSSALTRTVFSSFLIYKKIYLLLGSVFFLPSQLFELLVFNTYLYPGTPKKAT